MFLLPLCRQMQESFSRSSVSCLINANQLLVSEDSAEDKKSDPCWQVTQQLHYHIEKVFDLFPHLIFNLCSVYGRHQWSLFFVQDCVCTRYILCPQCCSTYPVTQAPLIEMGKMMSLHITAKRYQPTQKGMLLLQVAGWHMCWPSVGTEWFIGVARSLVVVFRF